MLLSETNSMTVFCVSIPFGLHLLVCFEMCSSYSNLIYLLIIVFLLRMCLEFCNEHVFFYSSQRRWRAAAYNFPDTDE